MRDNPTRWWYVAAMQAELHIRWGEGTTRVVPLSPSVTVGRSPACDVVVSDPSVSWEHVCIWYDAVGLWMRDLDSRNGTHLDGRPIRGTVPLTHGARIQAGRFEAVIRRGEMREVVRDVGHPGQPSGGSWGTHGFVRAARPGMWPYPGV